MNVAMWTVVGFACGSLMFAYWLGRLRLHVDIRDYGDGNPGAGNAWRAGGWRLGLPAALLDYAKAAVPVWLAHYVAGIDGWGLVPIGLAPMLGHAFSPFLGFRGGKSVAATFGVWTGLTQLGGPLALAVTCGVFWTVQRADGWTMVWGLLGLLAYLVLRDPQPPLFVVWGANAALILWTHRRDLREPMRWRQHRLPRSAG